jgi:hypothetical protein
MKRKPPVPIFDHSKRRKRSERVKNRESIGNENIASTEDLMIMKPDLTEEVLMPSEINIENLNTMEQFANFLLLK